jgi:hypothetical protein
VDRVERVVGKLGVIARQQIACSRHTWGNLINGASAHVNIAVIVGVHARIGVRRNCDVLGNTGSKRVVQRAHRRDHRSILVVADPFTLPKLSRVEAGVASKEFVSARRLDYTHLRVRPAKTIGEILDIVDGRLSSTARLKNLLMRGNDNRPRYLRMA